MKYAVDSIIVNQPFSSKVIRLSAKHFQLIDPTQYNASDDIEQILNNLGVGQHTLSRIDRFRVDGILFFNDAVSLVYAPRWNHQLHWVSYPYHCGVTKFPVVSNAQYHFELSLIPHIPHQTNRRMTLIQHKNKMVAA